MFTSGKSLNMVISTTNIFGGQPIPEAISNTETKWSKLLLCIVSLPIGVKQGNTPKPGI
jgi:hypothetical protein